MKCKYYYYLEHKFECKIYLIELLYTLTILELCSHFFLFETLNIQLIVIESCLLNIFNFLCMIILFLYLIYAINNCFTFSSYDKMIIVVCLNCSIFACVLCVFLYNIILSISTVLLYFCFDTFLLLMLHIEYIYSFCIILCSCFFSGYASCLFDIDYG